MKTVTVRVLPGCLALFVACVITAVASAQTRTIRVVTYNIKADNGVTTPLPGLIAPSSGGNVTNDGGVLEGIGEEILGSDPAQPLDILALQETTSNTTTVQPIVDGLNAFYSNRNMTAVYAMSTYQATQYGSNTSGNGPNALVYKTNTLQLVASVGVGTPSGSGNGEYRQVVRYEFAPAGVTPTTNNEFYIYVSHYKSGSGSSNATNRLGEAKIIRNDEATNLPADARVLYVGDYNPFNNSAEASYQTILSNSAPNGVMQGQGIDPLNTNALTTINWSSSTTDPSILFMLSDSSTALRYRDDLQVMTSNVYYGVSGGLEYVHGSYHTFGNNATTVYGTSVNSGSNTSLNSDLNTNGVGITASQLYQYLTTASDHLPVVADYTIPVPSPVASFSASPTNGVAPLEVTFTDTSTGSITNWFWDFGDGGTTNVTTNAVVYTYAAAGTYSVTEIVSGPGGSDTNTQANSITALTPPPVASFSGSPTTGTAPLTVTFTDTSTGSITNWFWDFGDGGTTNVTTNAVVYTYGPSTYTVTEAVSGPGGSSTNTQAGYVTALTAFQAWQIQYFTCTNCPNADPDADPDGDGMSNLQEFLAGTNPMDSTSTFRTTSIVPNGSDILLTWTMGSGRTNALQVASGNDSGGYTNIFSDIFTVTNTVGSVTNYLDIGAATNAPSRYYRIRLVP